MGSAAVVVGTLVVGSVEMVERQEATEARRAAEAEMARIYPPSATPDPLLEEIVRNAKAIGEQRDAGAEELPPLYTE